MEYFMPSEPELTIIIPTYNNPQGAVELVSDFYRLHDPDTFRIISIDQTADGIKFEEDKPVHAHVKAYRNMGFSKAMNTGLKLSQTKYTLLANDDVRLLSASWYEECKAHLKDGVLGVNPFPALRTWNAGGDPVWYWETNPDYAWTKDKPYESYTQEDYEKLQKQLWGGCPDGTTMFFSLLLTEARETIGLLDEAFWNGGEDYDWNRRCYLTCRNCYKQKGDHVSMVEDELMCPHLLHDDPLQFFEPCKILTCTHALVHHHSSVSKGRMAAAKEANGYDLVAKNRNIFNEKWGNPSDIYGKEGLDEPTMPWFSEVDM